MKFGYSSEFFTDVNVNDDKAITNLLSQKLISQKDAANKEKNLKKHNFDLLKSETFFIQNHQYLIDKLKNKELDIVILSPVDYWKIKDLNLVKPLFISSNNDEHLFKFYLVVNQNSQIKGFNDLKNKKIAYISRFSSLLKNWIYSKISNKNLTQFDDYFATNEMLSKSSQVLLKVLLNQVDACMIDEPGYFTANEMNSQLKNKLKIIEKSPGFPRAIICIRSDYESDILKTDIIDVLTNLHDKKDGKQILQLFNVNKLIKFDKELLTNLDLLMKNISKMGKNTDENSKINSKIKKRK